MCKESPSDLETKSCKHVESMQFRLMVQYVQIEHGKKQGSEPPCFVGKVAKNSRMGQMWMSSTVSGVKTTPLITEKFLLTIYNN